MVNWIREEELGNADDWEDKKLAKSQPKTA
jgi:hypothetical protein